MTIQFFQQHKSAYGLLCTVDDGKVKLSLCLINGGVEVYRKRHTHETKDMRKLNTNVK
jgi:hypothetical protein